MTTPKAIDRPALLVFEDGRYFEGTAAGAQGIAVGETVFNTSMTGYQEILTDPSYAGQLVALTMPHIGNYGVNRADMESSGVQAAGLIVRSLSPVPSNYRAEQSLPGWLADMGVVTICGVDTRAVARHLRTKGAMMGAIAHDVGPDDVDGVLAQLRTRPDYEQADFVGQLAAHPPQSVRAGPDDGSDAGGLTWTDYQAQDDARAHVVVVDYGVKFSILRHLADRGVRVSVVDSDTDIDQMSELDPDGILLSNGPGDPAMLDGALETVRAAADRYPTFGICLGHQLLARAFGAKTFKLPFGHRGPNQPVKDLASGHVAMTSQNHGYAVRADTLPEDLEITQINLNDDTVEGFRHRNLPVLSAQYHPEAGPGPHDASVCFDAFIAMIDDHAQSTGAAGSVADPGARLDD